MSRIVQYFSDKLKTLKEYPVTLTKAVYDEDGNRLDNKLSDIDNELSNMNSEISEKLVKEYLYSDPRGTGTTVGSTPVTIPLLHDRNNYLFMVITYYITSYKYAVVVPNYDGFNAKAIANGHNFGFTYSGGMKMEISCDTTINVVSIVGIK